MFAKGGGGATESGATEPPKRRPSWLGGARAEQQAELQDAVTVLDTAAAEEDGSAAAAAAAAAVLDPFAMIAADADVDSFTAPPEEGAFTVGPPSPIKTGSGRGTFSMSALQAGTGTATVASAATTRRPSGGSQGDASSCGSSVEP